MPFHKVQCVEQVHEGNKSEESIYVYFLGRKLGVSTHPALG